MLHARWARLLLTTLALVVAVACLLGRVVPNAWPRTSAVLFPPARTATPTATTVIPTPLPAMGILAPPPTDCPASAPLDSITAQPENFHGPVTMYGRSPLWMPGGYALQGTLQVYEPGTPDPYPGLRVLWEVGPSSYPKVTMRVSDLWTGELAWWSVGGSTPQLPVLVFEPRGAIAAGSATPVFFEGLADPIVTHAGCYKLDVTWDGGGWSSVFAVGGRLHV